MNLPKDPSPIQLIRYYNAHLPPGCKHDKETPPIYFYPDKTDIKAVETLNVLYTMMTEKSGADLVKESCLKVEAQMANDRHFASSVDYLNKQCSSYSFRKICQNLQAGKN